MLRRAVATLLFGAGIPILALSYMALRSISSEQAQEQRKVEAQAQHAAEAVADHLNEQLEHVERSLLGHVRDAVRGEPKDAEEETTDAGEAPLNATGRALQASLENLRRAEPLVRQGFLSAGGRPLFPWTHKAPPPREVDPNERDSVSDAISRAEHEPDPADADRILYYAWTGCKEPGLRAALRVAQASVREKGGFSDDAFKMLAEVRENPDFYGLGGEPIYPTATVRYAELAERSGDREGALEALLELADAVAEDRWHEEAGERRELHEAVLGEAERVVESMADPGRFEARRKLRMRQARAAFFEGFEEPILREIRAQIQAPGPGELTGPPFRFGTSVGDREPRLLSTIAVIGTITRDVAVVTSARSAHKLESRFLVGVDVDIERLRRWAEGDLASVSSTSESRLAIVDGWGRVFAGDEAIPAGASTAAVPFAKELSGWRVVSVPRDPEAPARAAQHQLRVSLALVATCALAALGSFSLALRAASREVEVAKVRGDLVRNVSHELRTPVASIQMLSEMLEDGGLGAEKEKEYVGRIAREARRLSRLIENVLDLARVERGARKVEPLPLPLGETVAASIALFKESEQGRDAAVVHEDGSQRALVPLDAAALEQILGNLLSNAVKYSPAGSEVRVESSADAARATIVVRDRGRGMSPGESQRLFKPFYRARPEDAAATGVGLGLVITRELIRLHGGELSVASEPGKGTAFTVTLPRGTA